MLLEVSRFLQLLRLADEREVQLMEGRQETHAAGAVRRDPLGLLG